jgi:hypothetical protein
MGTPHAEGAIQVAWIAFQHEELMAPQLQPEIAAALLSDLEDAKRRRDEHSPHPLTGDDSNESIVDTLLNPLNHAYLQFRSA